MNFSNGVKMITKERLLAGLDELSYVEEGMVTLFANFSKVMIAEAEDIAEEKKKEMKWLLNVLYRDSAKHKKMIDEMILKIRKDTKNEY